MNRTWPVRLRRSLRIWRGVHAKAVWNTGSRLRGADCEERDGRPGIDQEPRHQVGQRARRWLQGGPLRPLWDGAQGGTDIGFLLKLFKGVSYSLFHRASPVSSIFSGLEIPWQIAAIGSWDPLLISHVFCLNFFECWIELHVIAFGCMWLHLIVDCRLICICRLHCVFFFVFFCPGDPVANCCHWFLGFFRCSFLSGCVAPCRSMNSVASWRQSKRPKLLVSPHQPPYTVIRTAGSVSVSPILDKIRLN